MTGVPSQAKRQAILVAATEAFLRSGYAASVDEIAASAGVGKQTVYRHFGDKQALFLAAVSAARTPDRTTNPPDWSFRATPREPLADTHASGSTYSYAPETTDARTTRADDSGAAEVQGSGATGPGDSSAAWPGGRYVTRAEAGRIPWLEGGEAGGSGNATWAGDSGAAGTDTRHATWADDGGPAETGGGHTTWAGDSGPAQTERGHTTWAQDRGPAGTEGGHANWAQDRGPAGTGGGRARETVGSRASEARGRRAVETVDRRVVDGRGDLTAEARPAGDGGASSEFVFPDSGDPVADLTAIGEQILAAALSPTVAALHRLTVAEIGNHPELSRHWGDGAAPFVYDALAGYFRHCHEVGGLDVPDPGRAARQFAYLLVTEGRIASAYGTQPLTPEQGHRLAAETADLIARAHRPC